MQRKLKPQKLPDDPHAIYRKIGGHYKRVGMEFRGFPANGIWIVEDGRESLITRVGEVPDIMPMAQLKCFEDVACKALQECLGKTLSMVDVWAHVSKAIAREMFAKYVKKREEWSRQQERRQRELVEQGGTSACKEG